MTDILSPSLCELSPSLLKLLSNPVELLRGSSRVRCARLLLTHPCTQGPGRGVNPSCSCPTFLSLKFSQSKFSWKLEFFYVSQEPTWAPWTFQPCWLWSCTWSSVLWLILPRFWTWPADRCSCCSRPVLRRDSVCREGHQTPSWRALPDIGWRPWQSEGLKRVSKTSPELEQARLGGTMTRKGSNKVSFAVITRMFLSCEVLGSRKPWFSTGLWNAI